MYYRKSKTLVFFEGDEGLIGYNFLTKDEFECDTQAVDCLRELQDWKSREDCVAQFSRFYADDAAQFFDVLLSLNCLIEKGSRIDLREQEYQLDWEWNVPSAILHFAVTDREYLSKETVEHLQIARKSVSGTISVVQHNNPDKQILLQQPDLDAEPFNTMRRRRTMRETGRNRLPKVALADALFAGLGIVDWTENCANKLPLKLTPSGGARNPFEAYIAVFNVEGLEPAFYHYSALQHSIEACGGALDVSPVALLGGQEWSADVSAIVFLCADFRRTMWKYDDDDNAYRVVLIEAGHIAQNMMLAATHHGFSACPAAAISHGIIHEKLGIAGITESAIYSLAFNKMLEA